MPFYDVQITTDLGETVVLQIAASSPEEAELAAIHMVEIGQADVEGTCVVECFAGHAWLYDDENWAAELQVKGYGLRDLI